MRLSLLTLALLLGVVLSAQPEVQRDYERYREIGVIYLDAGQYDKALENLLLAFAAPDRRPDENIAPLIHAVQDRWAAVLRQARQNQQANQVRIRTLEEEYERVWQQVRAVQDTASRNAAQAQASQQQVTAFRLAVLADQARLIGAHQDALLLAARALELADERNQADIMYYFSLVVRDSFVQELPLSDQIQTITSIPNHILLQYDQELVYYPNDDLRAGKTLPQATMVAIQGEGTILSFATAEQKMQYYDTDGQRWLPLQASHSEKLTSAHKAKDYRLTTSRDNTAKLWGADGSLVADFTGHSGNVYDALFLESQRKVVTRSSDGTVRLWEPDGTYIQALTRQAYVHRILCAPDESLLLAATANGEVLRWLPAALEREPLVQPVSDKPVVELYFCGDEHQYWLSRDALGQLKFWNAEGVLLTSPSKLVSGAKSLPETGQVIAWTDSGQLQLFSGSGQLLHLWQAHQAPLVGVDYDPLQQTILSTAYDKSVKWWTLDGQQLLHWPLADNIAGQYAIFSSDFKSVLVPHFLPGRISIHRLPAEVLTELAAAPLEYPPSFKAKYGID